jgi:glyoxylase-like metal-dependent hydrolase (beta-lactamase superfamily II)
MLRTLAVGDAQVTLIRDGDMLVPAEELLNGGPVAPWREQLPAADDGQVLAPVHVALIRVDGEAILIDAGLGAGQGGGALFAALSELGLSPDDITRVVVTHTHGDHVGGAVAMTGGGFGPAFPRARHHLPHADWDWVQGMTEPGSDMYRQALAALPNVTLDASDDRLTASLRSIDAAGHTPGHRALVVESGGQTFCFLGDLVHVPELHFAEPERVTSWDARPELTPPARRRIAAAAVGGDWLLAATHASRPLGRLTPAAPNRWTWRAAE